MDTLIDTHFDKNGKPLKIGDRVRLKDSVTDAIIRIERFTECPASCQKQYKHFSRIWGEDTKDLGGVPCYIVEKIEE